MESSNLEHQSIILWKSFLEGNDDAYIRLYTMYANKLFTFGMHFSANRELVKDCTQDVFTKLYAERSKLKPVENVKVYLYTAMKNTLFNLFKKEKQHYHIDTIEPVFQIDFSPETRLIETERLYEQKKKIARMMEIVTPRQREVLFYRYVEELSYEEICVLMQMNYQSVRNLLHRTIQKIRVTISDSVIPMIGFLFFFFP